MFATIAHTPLAQRSKKVMPKHAGRSLHSPQQGQPNRGGFQPTGSAIPNGAFLDTKNWQTPERKFAADRFSVLMDGTFFKLVFAQKHPSKETWLQSIIINMSAISMGRCLNSAKGSDFSGFLKKSFDLSPQLPSDYQDVETITLPGNLFYCSINGDEGEMGFYLLSLKSAMPDASEAIRQNKIVVDPIVTICASGELVAGLTQELERIWEQNPSFKRFDK